VLHKSIQTTKGYQICNLLQHQTHHVPIYVLKLDTDQINIIFFSLIKHINKMKQVNSQRCLAQIHFQISTTYQLEDQRLNREQEP